jgi:hypothetical protein
MIQAREQLPHFQVTTIDGRVIAYDTIWQRRNLVLLLLPAPSGDTAGAYVSLLAERRAEIDALAAECVITADTVPGVRAPAVVIADRWGEVQFAEAAATVAGLPAVDELLDWLAYVQHRCPECEGEAR